MSLRGSRCSKHPYQLVVGVCAYCLRERLAVLLNVEHAEDANSSGSSPGLSLASEPITNGSEFEDAATDSVNFSARKPSQAGFDSNRSSAASGNSLRFVRKGIPFEDARSAMDNGSNDAAAFATDASPIRRIRKKTLSSLFSLENSESPTSGVRIEDNCERRNDAHVANSSSAAPPNLFHARTGPTRSRHSSFSERVESMSFLFPLAENGRPLSWFASWFRRRKKKSRQKSVEAPSVLSEHKGWEDARPSWEAPRPSSWEQFRFSSWEGPRSSWEPGRPSWEGVMRTWDGDSVLSGLDFCNESLSEVREDAELEWKGLQELVGYTSGGMSTMSASEAGGVGESRKFGDEDTAIKHMKLCRKKMPPPSDERERAKTFLSSKVLQLQRDVSTQTTPPRPSDATEKIIMQQQHHDQQQLGGRAPAASAAAAVWSKVWNKAFSTSKRVVKLKHKDEVMKEQEGDDQASTVSSNQYSSQSQGGHEKDYGASWNAYYTPVQKTGKVQQQQQQQQHHHHHQYHPPPHQQQQQQRKFYAQKGVGVDRSRTSSFSPFSLEHGMLRFYLTPVRSSSSRSRSRQRGYGPWL